VLGEMCYVRSSLGDLVVKVIQISYRSVFIFLPPLFISMYKKLPPYISVSQIKRNHVQKITNNLSDENIIGYDYQ